MAALARRLAGRIGVVAGLAQAVYWPAVQLSTTTFSENLHVPLLVGALCAVGARRARRLARLGRAGRLPARALGADPLGLAGVRAARGALALGSWRAAAAPRSAGCWCWPAPRAAILPWTARNAWLTRRPALIDDVGSFNLWQDNVYLREGQTREGRPLERGPARAVPRVGVAWSLQTVAANPGAWLVKLGDNLRAPRCAWKGCTCCCARISRSRPGGMPPLSSSTTACCCWRPR